MKQATTAACLNEGQKRAGGSKEEVGQSGIRITRTVKHGLSVCLSPSLLFHFGEAAAADSNQNSKARLVWRTTFSQFVLSCESGAPQWQEIQYVCNAHTWKHMWRFGVRVQSSPIRMLLICCLISPSSLGRSPISTWLLSQRGGRPREPRVIMSSRTMRNLRLFVPGSNMEERRRGSPCL